MECRISLHSGERRETANGYFLPNECFHTSGQSLGSLRRTKYGYHNQAGQAVSMIVRKDPNQQMNASSRDRNQLPTELRGHKAGQGTAEKENRKRKGGKVGSGNSIRVPFQLKLMFDSLHSLGNKYSRGTGARWPAPAVQADEVRCTH